MRQTLRFAACPSVFHGRRPLQMALLTVSVCLSLAGCAGGGTRGTSAPIEDRNAVKQSSTRTARSAEVRANEPPAVARPPVDRPSPATAQPRGLEEPDLPQQIALAPEPAPVAVQRNPAAQSLLAAAMQSATRGEWDRAQAALERAVKLAPDDSVLWRQLAYTHYRKGDLEQARDVAQRALTLAAGSAESEAASWTLIADIEAARGNPTAADLARQRASDLQ